MSFGADPRSGATRTRPPAVPAGTTGAEPDRDRPARPGVRADLVAGALSLGLVAAATTIGFWWRVRLSGPSHFPGAPPKFGEWPVLGEWLPHWGPGTPLALLIAVAAVGWGPPLAARLAWRWALAGGYLLAVGWAFALAMVDGWQRGVAGRLGTRDEYVHAVPGIGDIPVFLRTFTSRILDGQPDSLITHVAGHPPGATLVFVWLDRIGLAGGAWAGVVCVLVAGAAAVAVPVTVAALGRPDQARAALPFVALLPGAVWVGVSADALFAGVTATGIALLARAARTRGVPLGVAAGVVLGFGIFLSYGLVLLAPIALAVVWLLRSRRVLVAAVAGALAVVAGFAVAGFWWLDGYHLVLERYQQSVAQVRPYGYWVWADLACLVLAVGPGAAGGLRRAVSGAVSGGLPAVSSPAVRQRSAVVVLVGAAAVGVLAATLSGLSKAEVERIWLPFAVWLAAGGALLPESTRRGWLAAGAVLALLVNHVLLTNW